MPRCDGVPVWIKEGGEAFALQRQRLQPAAAAGGMYDEAWIQDLLYRKPEVFPIEQIEPGLGALVPVCRELVLPIGAGRSGALDNFFVTPRGSIVLAEAKLWRNPEARRAVVAQAMEYAAALFRMSYEALDTAVRRARTLAGEAEGSLYGLVSSRYSELDEADFVDAVSRNLTRGRAVVTVVGDGIREDILALAELLQSHAGHRFTFALVELAIYSAPMNDVRLVVPSVLAQTALIERGVVQIDDSTAGRGVVVTEPARLSTTTARNRSMSIAEDEFYELLDQREPGAAVLVKDFISRLEGMGVRPERQSGLNLKHASPSGNDLNLGTITKDGYLDTAPSTWFGRTEVGKLYNNRLAALIGGFVRDMKEGTESALRTAGQKTPRITDLLPAHRDAWLAAIQAYIQEIFAGTE